MAVEYIVVAIAVAVALAAALVWPLSLARFLSIELYRLLCIRLESLIPRFYVLCHDFCATTRMHCDGAICANKWRSLTMVAISLYMNLALR